MRVPIDCPPRLAALVLVALLAAGSTACDGGAPAGPDASLPSEVAEAPPSGEAQTDAAGGPVCQAAQRRRAGPVMDDVLRQAKLSLAGRSGPSDAVVLNGRGYNYATDTTLSPQILEFEARSSR